MLRAAIGSSHEVDKHIWIFSPKGYILSCFWYNRTKTVL
nr:MAG TPA: hypothetical protein [Caudoviricetes sp.]